MSTEYLTLTEIVHDIVYNMHEKDREYLLALPKKDLIKLHHTWGQHIRNFYKLWDPNNPLTMKDYEPVVAIVGGIECDVSPKHPDAISSKIMSEVWTKLHTEPFSSPISA